MNNTENKAKGKTQIAKAKTQRRLARVVAVLGFAIYVLRLAF
jgi:hypothetical protein